jgi:hypothetical protein
MGLVPQQQVDTGIGDQPPGQHLLLASGARATSPSVQEAPLDQHRELNHKLRDNFRGSHGFGGGALGLHFLSVSAPAVPG